MANSVCSQQPSTHDRRPSVITQAMLEEYEVLKKHEQRKKELRLQLIALLDAGATVESGTLTAFIHLHEDRRFTHTNLLPFVGPAGVEELKQEVQRTVQKQLVVTAADTYCDDE